ncbi:putative retroelement pol polyprotein [Senna tora]|uniref:Putative retroelement pol polyprotein n=1 Tax=Senna tora TaxID=362788 RepID=A0A834XHH2_9FABA|nr:putative retroelement pol polyprotein [Senna tora]
MEVVLCDCQPARIKLDVREVAIQFGSDGSTNGGSTKQNADDGAFQLHNLDHLGMALVLLPLTGPNYLTWSVAIKISLEAKDKIGFIDGTLLEPTNAAQYRHWKKVDSMVKA